MSELALVPGSVHRHRVTVLLKEVGTKERVAAHSDPDCHFRGVKGCLDDFVGSLFTPVDCIVAVDCPVQLAMCLVAPDDEVFKGGISLTVLNEPVGEEEASVVVRVLQLVEFSDSVGVHLQHL